MILWGYGDVGKKAYNTLKDSFNIIAFADSDANKHSMNTEYGIPVIGLEEVKKNYPNEEIVLCHGGNYLKAAVQLRESGILISSYFSTKTGGIEPYHFMEWTKMYLEDDESVLRRALYADDSYIIEVANKRLENIFEYAYDYTLFYRKRFDDAGYKKGMCASEILKIVDRLPILYREDVLNHEEEIRSILFEHIPHYEIHTSGTTGIPLKLHVSPNLEESHQNFFYKMMLEDFDIDIDYSRIVSIGGNSISEEMISKHIFWNDYPKCIYGIKDFSSLYLDSNSIQYYITEIERINPYIIRGYPSAVDLFVNTCLAEGIHPNIELKGIYLTSENVYGEQIERISNFFKCRVYGQYGNHEATHFAFTKPFEERYYCSPLYGFVQVVDEEGKQVQVGKMGRIVVTSLSNYASPVIKYYTGDVAVYGGVNKGFVILDKLLGKDQDYLLNKNGEKRYIANTTLDNHKLNAMNHIYNWQAIQKSKGRICLKLVKKPEFTQKDAIQIIEALSNEDIEANLEYVKTIPPGDNGKRRIIIHSQ